MDELTLDKLSSKEAKEYFLNIKDDLEERGYDSIKQMASYLISGDPGFISDYKECRNRIAKIDRTSLIERLLENYLK